MRTLAVIVSRSIKNLKSFLKLEVVWKDNDMFELKITVSNGQFSGTTKVYDGHDFLYNFANSLIGFPNANNPVLLYELGEKDGYSYFSMKFYPIDNVGHLGVQVTLESNVSTMYRTGEKDKLTLEIFTEPGLLDSFVKELATMAKNEEGQAVLEGLS